MSEINFAGSNGMAPEAPRGGVREFLLSAFGRFFAVLMNIIEVVIDPIQRRIGVNNMGYIFVLPNMLIFSIFVLFPMLLNFYYALTGGTALFPADREFVGMQNFEMLFDCVDYLSPNTCNQDLFWRAIYNTIFFVVMQVGGMVLLALITALVLNGPIVGRGFFRSVFFYPVLLSPVVVALIWKWILQREGLLNALLMAIGGDRIFIALMALLFVIFAFAVYVFLRSRIPKEQIWLRVGASTAVGFLLTAIVFAVLVAQRDFMMGILGIGVDKLPFLVQPPGNWATFWVIVVSIWAQMGFYTLILLAGLQSIPSELYEAGSIDGAGKWQSFRFITLPLLMPTMFVVLVLSLIRAVQVFDQVFVLTGGGPGTATQYMVQYIYDTGFANQIQMRGLAAAASVVLGLALLVLTILQLRLGAESELA